MAQLRQQYDAIKARGAEVLIVGPEKPEAFRRHWEAQQLPFIGLPDPDHRVARLYGQQVRVLKLGRMPAMVVIDRLGRVHYRHHGESMKDIPPVEDVLAVLDTLQQAAE
jgi:peroxiredoxin Q/BCP